MRVKLIDTAKVDRTIAFKLASEFEFWHFILFVTNCYDDLNDKIDWPKALKVSFYF